MPAVHQLYLPHATPSTEGYLFEPYRPDNYYFNRAGLLLTRDGFILLAMGRNRLGDVGLADSEDRPQGIAISVVRCLAAASWRKSRRLNGLTRLPTSCDCQGSGHIPRSVVQATPYFIAGHRSAEQKTLDFAASLFAQRGQLLLGLYALGGHVHAQAPRHR